MLRDLWSDVRIAVRTLVHNPVFAVAAILALTLGIGANTAIFSVLHSVVLSPLSFEEPEDLVIIWTTVKGAGDKDSVVPANFLDWRREADSFEELAGFFPYTRLRLFTGDRAEQLTAASVTGNFFGFLGVSAAQGRVFTGAGEEPVVVLGHRLWQQVWSGDRSVIGGTVQLNGAPYTVLGVMPPDFDFPTGVDLWVRAPGDVPQLTTDMSRERALGLRYMRALGRLADGVTVAHASDEMESIARHLETVRPERNANRTANIVPLHQELVGQVRSPLLFLMAMVAFVLLLACINAASLLMARATARQREVAVRIAMGAERGDLVRQLLVESLLLTLLSGALAVALAGVLINLLVGLDFGGLPRLDEVGLNPTVLLLTFAVALVTGLVFGLLPVAQAFRQDQVEALKEGARQTSGGRHRDLLRGGLVAAEIALAVVLLVGTGLLLRSFAGLQQVELGFDTEGLLTFHVDLEGEGYEEDHQYHAFFRDLERNLEGLPGVVEAAAVLRVPFPGDDIGGPLFVEGRPVPSPSERVDELRQAVTEGYFEAMGIELLSGRTFTDSDGADAPRVVVISRGIAEEYFGDDDPVGQRVARHPPEEDPEWFRVVGVVEDVRHYALDEPFQAEVYFPYEQWTWRFMDVVVKTDGDPKELIPQVRREVARLGPQVPLTNVLSMEERMAEATARPRFTLLVAGGFTVLAAILAFLGIYGVISYSMAQRRGEIGMRMALGADRRSILLHVLRTGLVPTLVGIALGLVLAYLLRGLLGQILYRVSTSDPAIYVLVGVVGLAVALAAMLVPAYRTSRIEPSQVLRAG